MSWQAYVDTQLLQKGDTNGCVEHGALMSIQDLGLWASTPNFSLGSYNVDLPTDDGESTQSVQVNELEILKEALANKGVTTHRAGLRINNEKYFLVNDDEDRHTTYLKKHGGGACLVRTNMAVIFASWNGALAASDGTPQNPGLCNEQCEKLADYLRSVGY